MIRPYIIKVKKVRECTSITIKSFRKSVNFSMIGVLFALLILILALLSNSILQMVSGKSNGVGLFLLLIIVILAAVYLSKDQLMIFSFDREERKLIRKLADFIWQNRLYSETYLHEIDFAISVSYCFEGTQFIVSLNAMGTGFAEKIQKKDIALQSLFPQFRLVDKRIFSDRTEYVFSRQGDHRIYVN